MPPTELHAIPGFADPFSSLSHLIGAAVFAALTVPLLRRRVREVGCGRGGVAALGVFAGATILQLSLSGVYHMLGRGGQARDVMQRLDHAAIFVLIAATFTPVHAILFRGLRQWGMIAMVWVLAALGVTLKSVYFLQMPAAIGMALYLGMGWVGAFSMRAIWRRYDLRLAMPLVLGGVAYTIGAVIEWVHVMGPIVGVFGAHEMFHVAALTGLALHWRMMWVIATMKGPEPPSKQTEPRGPVTPIIAAIET